MTEQRRSDFPRLNSSIPPMNAEDDLLIDESHVDSQDRPTLDIYSGQVNEALISGLREQIQAIYESNSTVTISEALIEETLKSVPGLVRASQETNDPLLLHEIATNLGDPSTIALIKFFKENIVTLEHQRQAEQENDATRLQNWLQACQERRERSILVTNRWYRWKKELGLIRQNPFREQIKELLQKKLDIYEQWRIFGFTPAERYVRGAKQHFSELIPFPLESEVDWALLDMEQAKAIIEYLFDQQCEKLDEQASQYELENPQKKLSSWQIGRQLFGILLQKGQAHWQKIKTNNQSHPKEKDTMKSLETSIPNVARTTLVWRKTASKEAISLDLAKSQLNQYQHNKLDQKAREKIEQEANALINQVRYDFDLNENTLLTEDLTTAEVIEIEAQIYRVSRAVSFISTQADADALAIELNKLESLRSRKKLAILAKSLNRKKKKLFKQVKILQKRAKILARNCVSTSGKHRIKIYKDNAQGKYDTVTYDTQEIAKIANHTATMLDLNPLLNNDEITEEQYANVFNELKSLEKKAAKIAATIDFLQWHLTVGLSDKKTRRYIRFC